MVSPEEIRDIIFTMPSNKSPGPDGYTVEFYRSVWHIIGDDVVAAVQSFFTKGFLPKGINSTILSLLPKRSNIISIKDYRPISCCNVLYKIIAKLISNRLQAMLPKMILSNQSAFVKGRHLLENVLLASELVKDYHKVDLSPRCAMMIDIAKAFDSVQWDFILNTLRALDFPAMFVHWIKLCVSSPSFSIQINGDISGYFSSSRGIRQGCPLSPYLFVICMDVLSRMLNEGANSGRFEFHPKCRNVELTHLCFADDLLVFVKGTVTSISGALNIFADFAALSGLEVSLPKSSMFTAGVKDDIIQDIQSSFQLTPGTLPVRYLGLPLMSKRMGSTDYLPLTEHIKSRLCSWTGKFLSYGGRLQLIKSVITSIITFWISAFRLPKKCIGTINGYCSAFLWSGPELKTTKTKIAWSTVCKPLKEGGLGIRNIDDSNNVSSLKLIWRLLSTSTLWSKWVKTYLLKEVGFWGTEYSSNTGSWLWRKLLKLRPLAKTLHRMVIGNGLSTSFWFDNWSKLGCFLDLTGLRGTIDLGIPLESTVAMASSTHRHRNFRTQILSSITREARDSYAKIQPLKLDTHHWKLQDGKFSTRFHSNATWEQIRSKGPAQKWSNGVWFTHGTPKYSFIAWLAVNNRLSTGDRLLSWSTSNQTHCFFCNCSLETRDHLFFACSFTSEIWRATLGVMLPRRRYTSHWNTIVDIISDGGGNNTLTFLIRYAFQSTLYHIWRERNNRRHCKSPSTKQLLIKLIDKDIRNRICSLPQTAMALSAQGLSAWFTTHSLNPST